MHRLIPLLPLVLCLAQAGCGSSRPKQGAIIMEDASSPPAAAADAEAGPAAEGETTVGPEQAAAAAAVRGESVPSRIAITIVPGLGYSVGGERIELDALDRLLARMAKANRYADIQLRTHDNGTAALIQPVLDLTQKHRLVNVTLHDGR